MLATVEINSIKFNVYYSYSPEEKETYLEQGWPAQVIVEDVFLPGSNIDLHGFLAQDILDQLEAKILESKS